MHAELERHLAAIAVLVRLAPPLGQTDLDRLEAHCRALRRATGQHRPHVTGLRLLRGYPALPASETGKRLLREDRWSGQLLQLHRPLLLAAAAILARQERGPAAAALFEAMLAVSPGNETLFAGLERTLSDWPHEVERLRGDYAFAPAGHTALAPSELLWSLHARPEQGEVLGANAKGNTILVFDAAGNRRREISVAAQGLADAIFADGHYWACDWGGRRIVVLREDGSQAAVLALDRLLPEDFPHGPERLCLHNGHLYLQCTARKNDKLIGGALHASGLACIALGTAPKLVAATAFDQYHTGGLAVLQDTVVALNLMAPAALLTQFSPDFTTCTPMYLDASGHFVAFAPGDTAVWLLQNIAITKLTAQATPIYHASLESFGFQGLSAIAALTRHGRTRLFLYSYLANKISLVAV